MYTLTKRKLAKLISGKADSWQEALLDIKRDSSK